MLEKLILRIMIWFGYRLEWVMEKQDTNFYWRVRMSVFYKDKNGIHTTWMKCKDYMEDGYKLIKYPNTLAPLVSNGSSNKS